MAFQVSPGVNVSEIDLTTVVPATSTTEGAIAGVFRWGPVNEPILISDENQLVQTFGKPHNARSQSVTPGTAEVVTFGAFVLPTAGTDVTDSFTLTVGSEAYTVTGEFADNATFASDLAAEIVNRGITEFSVGVDGNGDIALTYALVGNQTNPAYALEYTGGGTGGSDDTAPTVTEGTSATSTSTTWSNVETFYSAADFLGYSDALYVVRVSNGTRATGQVGSALENISAKYPGDLGNSISVEIMDATSYQSSLADSASTARLYEFAPSAQNFHVSVVDQGGAITGVVGTVLETFADLSLTAGDKDTFSRTSYLPTVLENRSRYISCDDVANIVAVGPVTSTNQLGKLVNGGDGDDESNIPTGDISMGYDFFENPEEIDVSFIIQGKAKGDDPITDPNYIALSNYLIGIANARRDCVAFISPAFEKVVDVSNVLKAITDFGNASNTSTYAVADTGYKYRYDKYNDQYVYTPLNADVAGLCARTDEARDPWFSPAGSQRGQIRNVVKLAYNPSKTDRDNLYRAGINPVITQAGQGTLLFGDKTKASGPSAFDRINVRRLFILLEKSIARASQSTLFEFNDEFTRAQFKNLVEPFLRDVQGRRGIYDFKVVCDETNNTASVIDRNEFVGDIYIKPARSINYIQLNFVAVATGVEFDEIVGGVA